MMTTSASSERRITAACMSLGLREPALADPAARQVSLSRLDEPYAARRKRLEVPAHGRVSQHVRVHRGSQQDRSLRREVQRAEEIIRDAVGELADDVRRTRR